MISNYQKFRIKKSFQRALAKAGGIFTGFGKFFRKHVIHRWDSLKEVRRFVVTWWVLILLLVGTGLFQAISVQNHYLVNAPAPGGTFVEGIVGELNNLNPIFANSDADRAGVRLIFSSLLRYDEEGELANDLTESWEVNEAGDVYTFRLRDDVRWHDGELLQADDVVFTFTQIGNSDTESPFVADWEDVEVTAKDDRTVEFRLPNPFAPFPHSLTTGIAPKHLLADIEPAALRPAEFNQAPVGSGPFKFSSLVADNNRLELIRNDNYFNAEVQLNRFVIQGYEDIEAAIDGYRAGELSAVVGLNSFKTENTFGVDEADTYDLPQYSNVFAFFNTSRSVVKEKAVRQAMVQSVDNPDLREQLDLRYGPADSPLIVGQYGYDEKAVQLSYNPKKAAQALDKAGWKLDSSTGFRKKKGVPLSISLYTQENAEYPEVAAYLAEAWAKVGIAVEITTLESAQLQRDHIATHKYDVLLIGITIGADPDIYVYWHGAQAKAPGFNFSEYKSKISNEALEAGRTRQNRKLRAAKYKTFLQQWRSDAPAVALYRPSLVYAQSPQVKGFTAQPVVRSEDRFINVSQWTVQTEKDSREQPYSGKGLFE